MFTLDAAPGRHRRLHPHHLLRLGHGGPPAGRPAPGRRASRCWRAEDSARPATPGCRIR